jgi:hypothetical protein
MIFVFLHEVHERAFNSLWLSTTQKPFQSVFFIEIGKIVYSVIFVCSLTCAERDQKSLQQQICIVGNKETFQWQ